MKAEKMDENSVEVNDEVLDELDDVEGVDEKSKVALKTFLRMKKAKEAQTKAREALEGSIKAKDQELVKAAEALKVLQDQQAIRDKRDNETLKKSLVSEQLKELKLELQGDSAWKHFDLDSLEIKDGKVDKAAIKNLITNTKKDAGYIFKDTTSKGQATVKAASGDGEESKEYSLTERAKLLTGQY